MDELKKANPKLVIGEPAATLTEPGQPESSHQGPPAQESHEFQARRNFHLSAQSHDVLHQSTQAKDQDVVDQSMPAALPEKNTTVCQAITGEADIDAAQLVMMQICGVVLAAWAGICMYMTYSQFVALLVPLFFYQFFWIVKRRLKIAELSPAKATLSVLVPIVYSPVAAWIAAQLSFMYESAVPMAVLVPLQIDVVILEALLLVASVYWQMKWTWVIGKRFSAVEAISAQRGFKIPKATLFISGLLVCLGFIAPPLWYSLVLFVCAERTKRVILKWDTLDARNKQVVIDAVRKDRQDEASSMIGGRKTSKKDSELMLIRYQSSSGLEQWVRERFSEKSWKKAAFILTIVALFVFFGGPLLMVQALPMLFSAGSAAGGAVATTPAGAAAVAANASIFVTLVQWSFLALLAAVLTYIARTPTHLELSPAGLRFLWRYPLFRQGGRKVTWSSIDDISIKRPFGKTLPQDASICLSGHGQELLKAKLKYIPSVDDKDAILHAFDKWSSRSTARAADVTELLSPPANHSYTELWLQALTAPPKRERLKPLMPDAILREETYRVKDQIGAGGQGFAYLATDLRNEQIVVLKEYLLPIFVDMESRRRAISNFEMEARTLQSLQSEQVVKLIDFFIEDHRAYLVLEHIDGESLKQLVERVGPLKTYNVLQLAAQMCEILRYLHNLAPPLVHRDFTPDNLILRPDGKLKLIDFNVAQKIDNESTFTGTIVGKQAYLPAEQFRGNACPASDIYALGCCLFYLLVGHDPEPITVSHPRADRADVPELLDQITAKATALEVEDRYGTVDDLVAAIHELLQKEA